jgi:hypothetical protein
MTEDGYHAQSVANAGAPANPNGQAAIKVTQREFLTASASPQKRTERKKTNVVKIQ